MHAAFDRSKLRILPLAQREHLLTLDELVSLDALPPPLPEKEVGSLGRIAAAVRSARRNDRAVVWCMGAHVIRRGLTPVILDLARRGLITHVAANGAAAIHDFEFALIGATTESVAKYIQEGQFGLWEETGRGINGALAEGAAENLGAGEAIGRMIADDRLGFRFPHKEASYLAGLWRLRFPATVHIAIGQDIVHEHPACDGAVLGATSYRDFLIFTASVERLAGGVFLNFGSQVMGPEIYLKALAMARNVAHQRGERLDHFVTANFDLVPLDDPRSVGTKQDPHYYYRPKKTLLIRSLGEGCTSYHVCGDHRATILTLYRMLVSEGD
jgi:hypothetical protein